MIAEIRGKGLLIGLKLIPNNREFMALARDQKLLIAGGGDNCVRLLPPLHHQPGRGARGGARSWSGPARRRGPRPRPDRPSRRMANPPRHFIDLWDIEPASLRAILEDAKARKAARGGWPKGARDDDTPGKDRTLAMIFQKNSTRTWFSFDAAIRQLGGASIISTDADMQLGRGETIEDTARVLSRMVDAVMIRANTPRATSGAVRRARPACR